MSFNEILTVTLTLFAVIDILGSLPIIIDLRKRTGEIKSAKATFFAGLFMLVFLFFGEGFLSIIGIDVESFALAGSIIIFILGIEMVLGINIFKPSPNQSNDTSIMPLAFPLIAGAGSLTTILSLKSDFETTPILIAIVINLAIVYFVLKVSKWLEIKMGPNTIEVLRRVFGVILLAIAIKIFKSNLSFVV